MSAKEHGIAIGRIVWYRSRTGDYWCPAVINCCTDTLDPEGVKLGHVPALTTDEYVHLTVFTPGKPGTRRERVELAGDLSENVAGCYQEWNVMHDPEGRPGTWRWPERI